jgi:hypothetical protein
MEDTVKRMKRLSFRLGEISVNNCITSKGLECRID